VIERPILFSAAMVRALLAGKKTQTRRVVLKSRRDADYDFTFVDPVRNAAIFRANRPQKRGELLIPSFGVVCPYGVPGDRLWVRESFSAWGAFGVDGRVRYRATDDKPNPLGWKPSIHMPRAVCRLTLEIADIRVQRLQDISEEDAEAEGAHRKIWITSPMSAGAMNARGERGTHRDGYKDIWEEINGPGSWDLNPWVWAITFRKL